MEFEQREVLGAEPVEAILSSMHREESFSGIGTVTVTSFTIGPDGNRIYGECTKHNLIVREGRKTLIDLLIGSTRKKLKFIRWGKGGAAAFPNGDPLLPFDVDDTDLDVGTTVLDKQLNPPERVTQTEIRYTETLISDQVDSDINEAALLFENPDTLAKSIFARVTFPTNRLKVDQGTGIEIKWSIRFDKVAESNT